MVRERSKSPWLERHVRPVLASVGLILASGGTVLAPPNSLSGQAFDTPISRLADRMTHPAKTTPKTSFQKSKSGDTAPHPPTTEALARSP